MTRKTLTAGRVLGAGLVSAMLLAPGAALAQKLDLDKAVATAGKWVAQADAGQAEAMWKASSPAMQKSVTQENWNTYLANLRKAVGNEQERSWVGLSKIDNPKDLPQGEYLNVVYATRFANVTAVETVSMARASSGWQPIGYIVREAKPNAGVDAKPAAPAQQPAAAK